MISIDSIILDFYSADRWVPSKLIFPTLTFAENEFLLNQTNSQLLRTLILRKMEGNEVV